MWELSDPLDMTSRSRNGIESKTYFSRYCVWKGGALQSWCSHLNEPVITGRGPDGGGRTGRVDSRLIRSPDGGISVPYGRVSW